MYQLYRLFFVWNIYVKTWMFFQKFSIKKSCPKKTDFKKILHTMIEIKKGGRGQ